MALINTTTTGVLGSTFFADGTGDLTIQQNGVTINQISSTGLLYGRLTSMTAQLSTSGTSIDFTSIPSWVKRITVMFSGVSTSGTSNIQIQLGTGATPTYTTSGYLGSVVTFAVGTMATANITSGFGVTDSHTAARLINGNMAITNLTGNTWSASSSFGVSNTVHAYTSAGSVPLAAALTAVRITTVNGTDTFDAGTINILYE